MNISIINLKDILRYLVKILILYFMIIILVKFLNNSTAEMINQIDNNFLFFCLDSSISNIQEDQTNEEMNFKLSKIMEMEITVFQSENDLLVDSNNSKNESINIENETEENIDEKTKIQISKEVTTEEVTDRNFLCAATDYYNTVKIDNQSVYTLTEDMLIPDSEIENKKDIIIYHTHTSESYTPSEKYNYVMTGNYRTTDSNYNVVKVGTELSELLISKGFNVIHDITYHDYPAYSGSYTRAFETASKLVEETPADLVIDIHRDAVGNGDTYRSYSYDKWPKSSTANVCNRN